MIIDMYIVDYTLCTLLYSIDYTLALMCLFDSQSLPFSNFLQFLLKSMTALSFVAIDFKKGLHDTFVINALLLKTKLKFSGT